MQKIFTRLGFGHRSKVGSSSTANTSGGDGAAECKLPFDQQSVYTQSSAWSATSSETKIGDFSEKDYAAETTSYPAGLTSGNNKTTTSTLKDTAAPSKPKRSHDTNHAPVFLAYYHRPKHPDSYHVALHIDMPTKPWAKPVIVKHHCKNILVRMADSGEEKPGQQSLKEMWTYERKELQESQSGGLKDMFLLGRVRLGFLSKLALSRSNTGAVQHVQLLAKLDVPKDKPLDFDCASWVVQAIEALRYNKLILLAAEDSIEASEDDGGNWERTSLPARDLAVDWQFDDVSRAGKKWIEQLKKENRAGVEVDGRLPEIGADELLMEKQPKP